MPIKLRTVKDCVYCTGSEGFCPYVGAVLGAQFPSWEPREWVWKGNHGLWQLSQCLAHVWPELSDLAGEWAAWQEAGLEGKGCGVWGWGLVGFLKNALLVIQAPREHRGEAETQLGCAPLVLCQSGSVVSTTLRYTCSSVSGCSFLGFPNPKAGNNINDRINNAYGCGLWNTAPPWRVFKS